MDWIGIAFIAIIQLSASVTFRESTARSALSAPAPSPLAVNSTNKTVQKRLSEYKQNDITAYDPGGKGKS